MAMCLIHCLPLFQLYKLTFTYGNIYSSGALGPASFLNMFHYIVYPQDIHKELEAKIAKFHRRDDAILYASCFDANAGLFEVLTGQQDALFSDQLNHASIIDGIRLAKTKKFRYKNKGETCPEILPKTF